MAVDPARAAGRVEHEGTTYYFCSTGCAAKFTADPKKYLSGNPRASAEHQPSRAAPASAWQAAKAVSPKLVEDERRRTISPKLVDDERRRTDWVCPMHQEVVSDRPGTCPKCGMALEPKVADLSDAPNPELVDMTRRFWIGVLLGSPVSLLTMGDMLTGGALGRHLGTGWVNWIGLALATPVVLWCG